MRFKRRNGTKTQDIVALYTEAHLTLRQIGKLTGLSHTAVSKRLTKAGVKSEDGEHVQIRCDMCGREFDLHRCKWRKSKEHFCSNECRGLSMENPAYKPWRQGSRLARRVVALHFDLQPEHVVHHIDGNQRNNNLDNLMVYASQADHMRAHHGKSKVDPICHWLR